MPLGPFPFFGGRGGDPEAVPDPGQRVLVRTGGGEDAWCGGFRALSGPITAHTGEGIVVGVAREEEYWEAYLDGRPLVGVPWPVEHVRVGRRRR